MKTEKLVQLESAAVTQCVRLAHPSAARFLSLSRPIDWGQLTQLASTQVLGEKLQTHGPQEYAETFLLITC